MLVEQLCILHVEQAIENLRMFYYVNQISILTLRHTAGKHLWWLLCLAVTTIFYSYWLKRERIHLYRTVCWWQQKTTFKCIQAVLKRIITYNYSILIVRKLSKKKDWLKSQGCQSSQPLFFRNLSQKHYEYNLYKN